MKTVKNTIIKNALHLKCIFLGSHHFYIFRISVIFIITCFCISGLFYTGFQDILVSVNVDYESHDCTIGIINIFFGFILLGMALSNYIVN